MMFMIMSNKLAIIGFGPLPPLGIIMTCTKIIPSDYDNDFSATLFAFAMISSPGSSSTAKIRTFSPSPYCQGYQHL